MIDQWLQTIPPVALYLLVGVVIMIESFGIPLPGEFILVSVALLASRHPLSLSPVWISVAVSSGAILGDSIGYALGNRYGPALFDRVGRWFPRHYRPERIRYAERVFARRGVWAVFFGRFAALLRMFAGPLAGSLKMPYPRFLIANACGGIIWGTGTTFVLYYVGVAAENWLKGFSWVVLIAVVLAGGIIAVLMARRAHRGTTEVDHD